MSRSLHAVSLATFLGLVLAALVALTLGPAGNPNGIGSVIGALAGAADVPEEFRVIVVELRLPRVLGAMLVGAALSVSGAVFQALFRNPLASPDLLGVSSGAALGASLALLLGASLAILQAGAFFGGLAAVAVVLLAARRLRGRDVTLTLILVGVVIGALLGACVSLAKVLADPHQQLPAITFWLMGSLSSIGHADLAWAGPLIALGAAPILLLRWRLELLTLSDDEVRSLGIAVGRTRWLLIAAATLMTAAATAIAGIIGWIGLLMPHAARALQPQATAPSLTLSALCGALFLLVVDSAARLAPVEIPPGILCALIGAPLFVALLARMDRAR